MSLDEDAKHAIRMGMGAQTMALGDLLTEDEVVEALMDMRHAVHAFAVLIDRPGMDHYSVPGIITSIVVDDLIRPKAP
jgi:hypothetical protein